MTFLFVRHMNLETALVTMDARPEECALMRRMAETAHLRLRGNGASVSVLGVHPDVLAAWSEPADFDDPWRLPLVVALVQQALRARGVRDTLERARVDPRDVASAE